MVQKVFVVFQMSLKVSDCWCEDRVWIYFGNKASSSVEDNLLLLAATNEQLNVGVEDL